jgi:hypothetical protein
MNTAYEMYRNGTEKLQDHLEACLQAFHERHGRLPADVVVSTGRPSGSRQSDPTHAENARAALLALGLTNLPVEAIGGCLAGEVWLGIEEA